SHSMREKPKAREAAEPEPEHAAEAVFEMFTASQAASEPEPAPVLATNPEPEPQPEPVAAMTRNGSETRAAVAPAAPARPAFPPKYVLCVESQGEVQEAF